MNKEELKREIRMSMRSLVSQADRTEQSTRIVSRLRPLIPDKGYVLTFIPLSDEPDIAVINAELKGTGQFAIVDDDRLNPSLTTDNEIVLALIPGRAFDREGNRLGRGGGTYDRVLEKLRCPKIGVAFDFQLIDNIPSESHDQKVDRVVTSLHDVTIR